MTKVSIAERPTTGPWVVYTLIILCTVIEAILELSDHAGLLGGGLRQTVYEWGAFWPQFLHGVRPLYAAQPYLMFVTYSFLHGGLMHLATNMVTLWSLGRYVVQRDGSWGFVEIYFAATLGGGIGYGLLATGSNPMVGASGALFGLAGAILTWGGHERWRARQSLWPVFRAALLLVLLNVVLWYATGGLLAWQTHLGGLVAGVLITLDRLRRAA